MSGHLPYGAVDLQKARREAAERFYAIGMSYLPEGWTYTFRKALSGEVVIADKTLAAPKPVTRKALYIWLHECAHANLHPRHNCKPSHVMEHEAEVWAHQKMREHGIPVPRTMTVRAKRYVNRKINQALRNGAKKIDRAAAKFARRK